MIWITDLGRTATWQAKRLWSRSATRSRAVGGSGVPLQRYPSQARCPRRSPSRMHHPAMDWAYAQDSRWSPLFSIRIKRNAGVAGAIVADVSHSPTGRGRCSCRPGGSLPTDVRASGLIHTTHDVAIGTKYLLSSSPATRRIDWYMRSSISCRALIIAQASSDEGLTMHRSWC